VVDEARAKNPAMSEAELLEAVKDSRYQALHDALRQTLAQNGGTPIVVSAPFTRYAAQADSWAWWAERSATRGRGADPGPGRGSPTWPWMRHSPRRRSPRRFSRPPRIHPRSRQTSPSALASLRPVTTITQVSLCS
jgi:hypothetical protein